MVEAHPTSQEEAQALQDTTAENADQAEAGEGKKKKKRNKKKKNNAAQEQNDDEFLDALVEETKTQT